MAALNHAHVGENLTDQGKLWRLDVVNLSLSFSYTNDDEKYGKKIHHTSLKFWRRLIINNKTLQPFFSIRMLKFFQGLGLNLADSFPGDRKALPNLLQG